MMKPSDEKRDWEKEENERERRRGIRRKKD